MMIAKRESVMIVVATFGIRQSENCTSDRRLIREFPGLSAIFRDCSCCIVGIGRIEIAAADDAMPRIAEGNGESSGAWRAYQGRVIGVPVVTTIARRENARRGCATGRDPCIKKALGCNA